jgi:magnesium chelatase family protein
MVTDRLGLSARSYSCILNLAKTIVDIEASENIRESTIQYRSLERKTS